MSKQIRNVQLWPAGKTVGVDRDIDDPECLIRHGWNDIEAPWVKPTDAERRAVAIEEYAARIQQNEIYCCDTSLVDDARITGGSFGDQFGMENVTNLRPDPDDWTMEQCKEWLEDNGHDLPDPNPWDEDREGLIAMLGDDEEDDEHTDEQSDEQLLAAVVSEMDAEGIGGLDDWRDAVRDNADDAEIYEWYRVSSWLCGELEAIGEPTLDNNYGSWWGRTCTGQALIMDGVLQRVAERHIK